MSSPPENTPEGGTVPLPQSSQDPSSHLPSPELEHSQAANSQPPATQSQTKARKPAEKKRPAATPAGNGTGQAVWTDADIKCLLAQLKSAKSQSGEGGSFPQKSFNQLAPEVDAIRTRGGKKTGTVCKNKFSNYLRPNWKACCDIDAKSGLGGYDLEYGANIVPETASIWEDLVKANPAVKPYRNIGWAYHSDMAEIMPKMTRNQHIFQADTSKRWSSQEIEPGDSSASQPWEIEDPSQELPDESQEDSESQTTEPAFSQMPTPSTPAPAQKRVAAGPPPSSTKRPRLSASASAMNGIGTSMNRFTDVMVELVKGTAIGDTPQPAASTVASAAGTDHLTMTPRRRCHTAQQHVEELDWLTQDEQLDMLDLFEKAPSSVDLFLGFKDNSLRQKWVMRKLAAAQIANDQHF
ncbi:hypothetical protein V5O48_010153 [Marasmius crinis-equi]|uniref:Myb-like domain-containing protein n=1 Tax=Marasmius crinis-equi TaxID=585013 RepID=A0ABR3F9L6_9AGAR